MKSRRNPIGVDVDESSLRALSAVFHDCIWLGWALSAAQATKGRGTRHAPARRRWSKQLTGGEGELKCCAGRGGTPWVNESAPTEPRLRRRVRARGVRDTRSIAMIHI